jgi:hypothetical protein
MPIVGSFAGASARAYGAGAGTLEVGEFAPLSTITVGAAGQATIEFTGIPSSYTHLQFRGLLKRTSGSFDVDVINFNGDTGNNYSYKNLYADGTSVGNSGSGNIPFCYGLVTPGSTQGANNFGAFVLDILDYTDTNKFKTVRSVSGTDSNGSGYAWFSASNWRNTNAITSVKFTPASGSYIQYTSIALYGVKA